MSELKVTGYIAAPSNLVPKSMKKAYTYQKKVYSGLPEDVKTYVEGKNHVHFPRNLQKMRRFLKQPFSYNVVAPKVAIGSLAEWFDLYDYQKESCDAIVEHFKADVNVLFQAGTRYGKTSTALGVFRALGVRTLVLVDKTLLNDQFINDWLDYSGGTVRISNLSANGVSDVTVSTLQYLNANPKLPVELKDTFGLVIVDELHVSAATTYQRIIQSFNCRYRLGMTATPSRSADGLTGVLTDIFGDVKVIGVNPDNMTVHWKEYMLPKVYPSNPYNPSATYEKYFLDPEVTENIIGVLLEHKDKTVLLATNSKKVQNHYMSIMEGLGITTCVFNSEAINKKRQADNLQAVADGTITMFAGLNVLLKGVSIPRLEVVVNLFAVGSIENLQQLVGRLKTKHKGKGTPLFISCKPKFGNGKSDRVAGWLTDMTDTIKENP